MICGEFCDCLLCLELKGSERKIQNRISDNFVLKSHSEKKKYRFFGMDDHEWEDNNLEKYPTIDKTDSNNNVIENKHKSVIYVANIADNTDSNVGDDLNNGSCIRITEKIDEFMSLDSIKNSNVINVIFKNTFSLASQLINEIGTEIEYYSDTSSDDFPLGMEADFLKPYLERRRLSSNSKGESSYHHENRVNTPAKLSMATTPTTTTAPTTTTTSDEGMVSPKRKVEPFQHFYIANNVKTSTFNEQIDQKNLINTKNNLNNYHESNSKYSCGNHAALNMVPERDTNSNHHNNCNKTAVNLVGNLPISKYNGGNYGNSGDSGNEDHRLLTSRQHHHITVHEIRMQQRVQNCNSSSDENRSSGHASMSDNGNSSPRGVYNTGNDRLTAGVMNKPIRNRSVAQHNRSRHRATPARLHVPWTGSGGLEDIKLALQQLTIRSHTSTSTYSSISAGSESSEPAMRRLIRHSSLETINTNITNADEFVWVDSHNRLVELQHLPWTNHCILKVLQCGHFRDHVARVNLDTIPRLSYLLQRALVRIGREIQRLSSTIGICTKHDVMVSFRIILCPPLADSCIKACLRAAAMLAMSSDCALKQSKSLRAGLQFHIGRFHRWMADTKLARFVHEYAAVYLCAGLENLLEEIMLQCLPSDAEVALTATVLEHSIANNGDLWGLLQPYAHLNAGRIASGALSLPRWASISNISNSTSPQLSPSTTTTTTTNTPEPSLMTTCVGSLNELQDLINRIKPRIPLCTKAIKTLFYFMRCSQLEHGEQGISGVVQELCYERAYVVLPPLIEWLRVAIAHCEHRFAPIIDKDDIMQAARLLLPGVDCPVRFLGEESVRIKKNTGNDDDNLEASKQIQIELAFRLLLSGRPELIQHATTLLPVATSLDTLNCQGHTALMLAAINNDEITLTALLDAGASVDVETPPAMSPQFSAVNGETQHWTALTYAAAKGHLHCAKILLERGANVEGGALLSEEKCTLTPLQVASASNNSIEMVALLLAHGANPFFTTQIKDPLCYSVSLQKGCYSAISVAAAHGQRIVLQKLLAQPIVTINNNRDVLSLEEILAEGAQPASLSSSITSTSATTITATLATTTSSSTTSTHFTKAQIKALQEAMYHSAENNHLDITVEIRTLGVPWTLHCWMHSLGAAHEARLDCVIDQLLQDFLQVCPDDYSSQFVQECLPLLFNIFRYSKKEGTTLLLADIFSTCFGWEPIKPIKDNLPTINTGSRIDPKYVNNPELSDVTFRVEGRLFYAHKIVLVTASARLRSMLSSKLCEGGLPTVQINDIRYDIFQIVMQFLYQGGCQAIEPSQDDILELMAAANFFQLDGLLRYCESRCANMLALDNVVSMYIHAKVYNAVQLLEYCQGFLLQNMVALLTYDDSVKRLLFAKKLPNHDVLAGLLNTLQNRIKARKQQNNFKHIQNFQK